MSAMSPEVEAALKEQKANCPFCKIVKGEIPARKVYEDDLVIAVLDINPSRKGHVLVMPKEHYPIMPLIPPETFKHLFHKVGAISRGVRKGVVSLGTTVFIANGGAAGQQSQHFLLHVIPRDSGDGLDVLTVPQKGVEGTEYEGQLASLKNNLTVMMRNHFAREGKVTPQQMSSPKITREQLNSVLNSNPQLKEAIITQTEQFKVLVKQNPQLKTIFEQFDIDALAEELRKERSMGSDEQKSEDGQDDEEHDEQSGNEDARTNEIEECGNDEKRDADVTGGESNSLDDIAGLF